MMFERFFGVLMAVFVAIAVCGCIVIGSKGGSEFPPQVLIANPQNVYRTSTNIVIKALVQDDKSGKWVEAKHPVLIPAGYYIGSGM